METATALYVSKYSPPDADQRISNYQFIACNLSISQSDVLHVTTPGFELDGENKAKGFVMWKLQSPHVRAFHVSACSSNPIATRS